MKRVILAGPKHREAIADLIVSSYASAKDFKVIDYEKLKNLAINPHPDAIALIAVEGTTVLSVMHGRICRTSDEIKSALPHLVDPSEAPTPSLVLFQAATVREYRRTHLNALLRLYFLKFALKYQARYLVGTVYEGADRTKTMEAMGYSFGPINELDHVIAERNSRALMAILELDIHSTRAAEYLKTLVGDLIHEYPFDPASSC